jgi:hypothetical protein
MQDNIKSEICKTIILPAVLFGRETWSLTLREERRLRVLESRMLRVVFGGKREAVTGAWRKLQSEGLYDWYCLPDIVRVMKLEEEMGSACGLCGEEVNCIQGFNREN